MAYTEEGQQLIERWIGNENFKHSTWDNVGTVSDIDARWMYIDALSENIDLDRRWRVVCDLFNGATCTIVSHVFESLGCDTTLLNAQPDGSFPAGDPEPAPKSLLRLGKIVRAVNADIGFGFDGDGDRMMPVDRDGRVHNPDRVLAAYAGYVVRQRRRAEVVTHIGTSMCIEEKVKEAGGSVVRTKVGDVSIASALREHSAVFGGEPVGAWIHPEVHLCPDGILSALKLLKALEEDAKTLAEFVADVPEYPLLRVKIPCPNERKARVMKAVKGVYPEAFSDVLSISAVDGVRLDLEDGWVLIRPSGTEPVIRITVEARVEEFAQRLMERSRRLINEILVKMR
jgi:phosphoglucosamine mutase